MSAQAHRPGRQSKRLCMQRKGGHKRGPSEGVTGVVYLPADRPTEKKPRPPHIIHPTLLKGHLREMRRWTMAYPMHSPIAPLTRRLCACLDPLRTRGHVADSN
uniref:Uncharacterized protein n=1 Tax=Eutreptiella gymnastica TaxID=73025 RepID=A0A7S4LED1_9EUGL